jgi:AraC family transcriptional regulator of adaptative response/methylated-DNA-[protein]-cysteine methyltransferase
MSTMPTTYRAEPVTLGFDDDEAWRAVEARDSRFDGQFVYAVKSTRIYCRPSCPSRRPDRRRVTFYSAPDAAEEAGYRACRRCHPRETRLASAVAVAVERARQLIEKQPDLAFTLAELAARVGVSPFHLQRTFKRLLGVSPREYQDALRVTHFKSRLRAGDTVSRATYEAGFGSSSRVYERSDRSLGMTPAGYRRGGAGMQITYTVIESVFGKLLVATTARGVCAVALGDSDQSLVESLRADFPSALVERADDAHHEWVEEIVRHIGGGNAGLSAARSAGNGISTAGLVAAPKDPTGQNEVVRGDRRRAGESKGNARGCSCLCQQSSRRGDSVSSRRAHGRDAWRLSVGC